MEAENLVNTERRMLKVMLTDSTKVWSLSDILVACDWQDQAIAVGAGLGLADKGLAQLSETVSTEVKLGAQGQSAVSEGLLEARLWNWFNLFQSLQWLIYSNLLKDTRRVRELVC